MTSAEGDRGEEKVPAPEEDAKGTPPEVKEELEREDRERGRRKETGESERVELPPAQGTKGQGGGGGSRLS